MTVAEYLADQLYNAGIRHVFGIPGGASIPYIEAFRQAGIEFILVSHESAAGIMADVTARLTGVPGVCHATFGPGATNITTGAGGAFLDRSPVIVLTSELNLEMIHRTSQMNIDHQKLFEPVTKATFRLSPDNAGEVIAKALQISRQEYPGPVHIGLPSGISGAEANREYKPANEQKSDYCNYLIRINNLLENARSPIIAAGLTSARLLRENELLRFLDKYSIPVVVTPMAKGIIPENHPCFAGVLFHALCDYLEDIIEKCDLVIGLGYDPVEYNYESWLPDVPLIHFNTIETDLPAYGNVLSYIGDPSGWFSVLGRINPGSLSVTKTLIRDLREEMTAVFEGFTGSFGPVTALKVLMEVLPSDTILTSDVGSHLHLIGQYWMASGRNKIIMTNGWSGMGFGIPAGLAAKLASPSSTVVTVTGDGGFLMMAGEIITARRYNIPLIVVVFSDEELNLIRLKKSWQDLSPYGTSLYSGDLFCSSSFLGVPVIEANTEEGMRKALDKAISEGSPVIINARIDPEDYKWLVVRQD